MPAAKDDAQILGGPGEEHLRFRHSILAWDQSRPKPISHIHIAFPTHIHIAVAHTTVTHVHIHRVIHLE